MAHDPPPALETALRAAQSQAGGSPGTPAFGKPSCLTLEVPGACIYKLAEREQHLLLGLLCVHLDLQSE